jgi:hypothetical protein
MKAPRPPLLYIVRSTEYCTTYLRSTGLALIHLPRNATEVLRTPYSGPVNVCLSLLRAYIRTSNAATRLGGNFINLRRL